MTLAPTASASELSINAACSLTPANCVLALDRPGEDPAVYAVRQLLIAGNEERARWFAAERAVAYGDDATQEAVEAVLATSTRSRLEQPAPSEELAARDGVLTSPWSWELHESYDYTYCIPTGCDEEPVGSLHVDLVHGIFWYPDTWISGRLSVERGPRVRVIEARCTIFHELWPFDQAVHEFPACTHAQSPSYVAGVQINEGAFDFFSREKGDKFHLESVVRWQVEGDATGSTLAILKNSHSYRVYASGWAEFLE
ncbi:hypothetical protein [Agromyces aerolatus]|uniref:hypothetical protein n=1 Tax=Agromyces sp. LY-1074 TaxID=3074080 RepID=UPI002863417B|nr:MULTISPECIES: hypothetical protein [unclassified Agromyces]MDR5700277.1 hypothetical protein [Agromyces sp. LY-1074]MDR5706745.1 hypothetical protein [Agromyces sp. LY-1358]